MSKSSLIRLFLAVGPFLATSSQAADVVPEGHPPEVQAVQAKQFGMFLGAAASQYDLCVAKGFAPKSTPSAEEMAESFLKVVEQRTQDPESATKAREGWQLAKQDLAKRAADYDQGRCNKVVVTWKRLLPIVGRASK